MLLNRGTQTKKGCLTSRLCLEWLVCLTAVEYEIKVIPLTKYRDYSGSSYTKANMLGCLTKMGF